MNDFTLEHNAYLEPPEEEEYPCPICDHDFQECECSQDELSYYLDECKADAREEAEAQQMEYELNYCDERR